MGIAQYMQQSHNVSHTFFHFALRLVTGLLLLLKGIYFVSHSQYLETIIMASNARSAVTFLVGYISFAHLFGGAFIMLGLLTRFAVILQIPIVIGALYYNLTPNAFGTSGGELLLSIVVLVLLIYVLLYGSGSFSMDDYLKKHLL